MTIITSSRRGLLARLSGIALGGAALGAAFAGPVHAQAPDAQAASGLDQINLVATSGAPIAPLMLGMQNGMMAAQRVAVKFTQIPLMPSLPAILVSGSGDIGFMTTTTFLQAVYGGLDLVEVAGGGVTSHTVPDAAVLSRPDVTIANPHDFEGKTVGVPGLGAYYHVVFSWWLMQHGVDPAAVHFQEVSFPSMADTLRGRSVDAVVTLDPFQTQILNAGVGKLAVPLYRDIPDGKPIVIYVATRAWADAHKDLVHRFRAGLAQAQAAAEKDIGAAKAAFAKVVPIPPAILAHVSVGAQSSKLDTAGLQWWIDVMTQQKLLNGQVDVNKLIAE